MRLVQRGQTVDEAGVHRVRPVDLEAAFQLCGYEDEDRADVLPVWIALDDAFVELVRQRRPSV